ncbi:MAG TPA: hypothetical protein VN179_06125 [Solirubrobacterales bacterium]|nr:hypothetical protein [Solirubrobacterales bacterium]
MTSLRNRSTITALALAAAAVLLLAPAATAAPNVPTLASTPQYKAFVQYVAKMRSLQGKPATAARKATYESKLSAKHQAAVNKANALFQRAKAAVKAETRRSLKEATEQVRQGEAAELAELRQEYVDRLDAATASAQRKLDLLVDRFNARQAAIQRQIAELRVKKAKAKSLARKDQIQAQINVLVEQIANSRRQEREQTAALKARYAKQKRAIVAGHKADVTEVREERQEAVDNLRARWNRTYNREVETLQEKRVRQLAQLEAKLNAGRAAIASMPAA